MTKYFPLGGNEIKYVEKQRKKIFQLAKINCSPVSLFDFLKTFWK